MISLVTGLKKLKIKDWKGVLPCANERLTASRILQIISKRENAFKNYDGKLNRSAGANTQILNVSLTISDLLNITAISPDHIAETI